MAQPCVACDNQRFAFLKACDASMGRALVLMDGIIGLLWSIKQARLFEKCSRSSLWWSALGIPDGLHGVIRCRRRSEKTDPREKGPPLKGVQLFFLIPFDLIRFFAALLLAGLHT